MTYLIASQLLANHLTDEWLTVDHVIESTKMWLASNGCGAQLVQRAMLSSRATEIAQRIAKAQPAVLATGVVTTLFSEKLRLDFRNGQTRELYQMSLNYLIGTRWF
ncbi:hypothetical protein [Paraburkholderia sp. GAS42]|uniref:hypothetical protein n=1 Tax=Paraburkholderia sp. GAS42 TaxID=3035135 RepID=UPI003D1C02FF